MRAGKILHDIATYTNMQLVGLEVAAFIRICCDGALSSSFASSALRSYIKRIKATATLVTQALWHPTTYGSE